MFTFLDLLVYQAITNVIADPAYEIISPYYDKVIFGNIVNTSKAKGEDKKFFTNPGNENGKDLMKFQKNISQMGISI